MGSKWQKHFVRKWISDQAEAHSQMLILASRFLWFHFARLIEKKKALPQNINQQYIMNVFRHVSKSSRPSQRDNKIDDDLLQEDS
jgi:hypothetical protein